MNLFFRQSEFSAFQTCRREWMQQYRLRLVRKREKPSAAGLGTLVHAGHEAHWTGRDPAAAIEALAVRDRLIIVEKYLPDYEKQVHLAKVMLEGYVDWLEEEGAAVGETVVSVERQMEVPFGEILGHEIVVGGKSDREIIDVYGQPKLIDLKTRDQIKVLPQDQQDFQRQTYAVLRMMEDGQMYTGAIHEYMRKVLRGPRAVPPFYGRHEVHFTVEQLRKHYLHLVTLLEEMIPLAVDLAEGVIQPDDRHLHPHVTKDCDWRCRFQDVCPLFDDGSGAWKWIHQESYETIDQREDRLNADCD